MPTAKRAAVADAQLELNSAGARLVVDGQWGPKSQAAYDRAPVATRGAVLTALAAADLTPVKILEYQQIHGTKSDFIAKGHAITSEQLDSLLRDICEEEQMSAYLTAFRGFVRREAVSATRDGVTYYDTRSVNGTSRGLMQFQPAAWSDVRYLGAPLASYAEGVFDARQNLTAGVRYAKSHITGLVKARYPVNEETLYLAHNQGMHGFLTGKWLNYGGQSKEVQALIDRYSNLSN